MECKKIDNIEISVKELSLAKIMDNIQSLLFDFDQTDPHDQLPCQTADKQNNNILLNPFEYGSDLIKGPNASNSFAVNDDNPKIDTKKRKMMHRDLEKRRRQEMSILCRSLRCLLPLEYIKGKRSTSDHMHGAVNYIKDLQNRIQELREKRDTLRRFSNSSSIAYSASESERSQNIIPGDSVSVRPCLAGVEIVISSSCRKELPLSQVFALLVGESLTIVNCISNKMNERLLLNIESEVNGGRSIDHLELKQKVMKLIRPPFK